MSDKSLESYINNDVSQTLGTTKALSVVPLGPDGTPIVADVITGYKVCDVDADSAVKYYGYADSEGAWYIMKETTATGDQAYRYAKGSSGYAAAWTDRANPAVVVFDYYYTTF